MRKGVKIRRYLLDQIGGPTSPNILCHGVAHPLTWRANKKKHRGQVFFSEVAFYHWYLEAYLSALPVPYTRECYQKKSLFSVRLSFGSGLLGLMDVLILRSPLHGSVLFRDLEICAGGGFIEPFGSPFQLNQLFTIMN